MKTSTFYYSSTYIESSRGYTARRIKKRDWTTSLVTQWEISYCGHYLGYCTRENGEYLVDYYDGHYLHSYGFPTIQRVGDFLYDSIFIEKL